jgi:hypothetical protein
MILYKVFGFLMLINYAYSLEVAWLLDSSSSIGHKRFTNMKKLVEQVSKLVLDSEPETKFSLVNYGHKVTVYATKDNYIFFKKLDHAGPFGSSTTKTSLAFEQVNRNIFNHGYDGKRVIVSITDGNSNPAIDYGGTALITQINQTIQEHNLTRLIYVEVTNHGTHKDPSNENAYVQLGSFYNVDTDRVQTNFVDTPTEIENVYVRDKILGYDITKAPSSAPSASQIVTSSPTKNPSSQPSTSPTDAPTQIDDSPTNPPSKKDNITPENTDTNDDDGYYYIMIVFSVLGFVLCVGGFVYYRRRQGQSHADP